MFKTIVANVRSFLANDQQRKTAVWVIGTLSLVLVAFGMYQIVTGYLDYNDQDKKYDDVTAQIESFISEYPLVERDGEMTHDLTGMSTTDQQYLALLHTRERAIYNDRVDAANRRSSGIRLIGIGIIGVAFAYLMWPENTSKPGDDVPETKTEFES